MTGAASPSQVVIWNRDGSDVDTDAVQGAIADLKDQAQQPGGLIAAPVAVVKVDRALVVRLPLAGSGTDETSVQALRELRERILPATVGQADGVDYAVGGRTATANDFAKQMTDRAPWCSCSCSCWRFCCSW